MRINSKIKNKYRDLRVLQKTLIPKIKKFSYFVTATFSVYYSNYLNMKKAKLISEGISVRVYY